MVRSAMMAAVAGALLIACGGGDGATVPAVARPATDRSESGGASAPTGPAATSTAATGTAAGSEAQASSGAVVPANSTGADIAAPGVHGATALPQPVTPVAPQAPATPPAYIGPMTPDLKATVDAAVADAAKRTGLAGSALVVVSAEAVVWADGSLGCPAPGAFYTMALVPGHRVRIRAGDDVLDYHAGGRQLILCPAGRASDPLPLESS